MIINVNRFITKQKLIIKLVYPQNAIKITVLYE